MKIGERRRASFGSRAKLKRGPFCQLARAHVCVCHLQGGVRGVLRRTGLRHNGPHAEHHRRAGQDDDGFGNGAQRGRLYHTVREPLVQRYVHTHIKALAKPKLPINPPPSHLSPLSVYMHISAASVCSRREISAGSRVLRWRVHFAAG